MECRLAEETEVLGENLPQRHFCPSQNPTWPDPGLKPGRRGGKPATNRLSYGAASHPRKIIAKSCFVHILIITFLNNRGENERLWTEWQWIFPVLNVLLFVQYNFDLLVSFTNIWTSPQFISSCQLSFYFICCSILIRRLSFLCVYLQTIIPSTC
jgi:hypothetical protein